MTMEECPTYEMINNNNNINEQGDTIQDPLRIVNNDHDSSSMTTAVTTATAAAGNSNCTSSTGISTNVHVAESDFQNAISAIESIWNNELLLLNDNKHHQGIAETSISKRANDNKSDNNNNQNYYHEQQQRDSSSAAASPPSILSPSFSLLFTQQVYNSLRRNLHQMVEPMKDEDYHGMIFPPEEENREQQNASENDDCIMSILLKTGEDEQKDEMQEEADDNGQDESDEEVDFDPEELLDIQALERARELRERVRKSAAEMQNFRNSIVQRSIELAQRQIRLCQVDNQDEEENEKGGEEKEHQLMNQPNIANGDDNDFQQQQRREIVETMGKSLENLSKTLHTLKKDLPDRVDNLHETVSNVEKTLLQQQKPEEYLSQTERAIISNNEENYDEDEKQILLEKMELDMIPSSKGLLLNDITANATNQKLDMNNPQHRLIHFFNRCDL